MVFPNSGFFKEESMLKTFHNKKGQSTLEYVLLISTVIVALVVVQKYLKRAVQGQVTSAAGQIGDDQLFDYGLSNETRTTTSRSFTTGEVKNKAKRTEHTADGDVAVHVESRTGSVDETEATYISD
jgi:uncharacterized protein (UPF0333 family)